LSQQKNSALPQTIKPLKKGFTDEKRSQSSRETSDKESLALYQQQLGMQIKNFLDPAGHRNSFTNQARLNTTETSIGKSSAVLDGKRKGSQKLTTRTDQLDVKTNQALIAKMSQTGLITRGNSSQ